MYLASSPKEGIVQGKKKMKEKAFSLDIDSYFIKFNCVSAHPFSQDKSFQRCCSILKDIKLKINLRMSLSEAALNSSVFQVFGWLKYILYIGIMRV